MSFINLQNWRGAMQNVSAAIDAQFGESIKITPCTSRPNFPTTAHEDEAITVQGVFQWKSETIFRTNSITHRGAEPAGLVESRKPCASFSRASLKWALNRGDRVTRCCDGNTFEITAVKPDGVARIEVELVQLGAQEQ